jgi:hypothetical protein
MIAAHDEFIVLVECFYLLSDKPEFRFLMVFFFFNGYCYAYGIADEYGFDKTQVIVAIGHRYFIYHVGGKADGDGEDQCAVCNAFFEGLRLAPFFVHVVGEKIARLPGMNNDISFCDGAAFGQTLFVGGKFFKILLDEHGRLAIVGDKERRKRRKDRTGLVGYTWRFFLHKQSRFFQSLDVGAGVKNRLQIRTLN